MMFYRVLRMLFHFVTIFYCASGEILPKKNEKRLGIPDNFQMCLDNFEIHKDEIIMTRESLRMGAKYLNEMEAESRQECLKYCCDTVGCDVFIFEEKKLGICYLFQCGPLHNFKCKFTNHDNYTSAVHTTYDPQNSPQLIEEMRISQQEHELKSLRRLGDAALTEYVYTEPSVKVIATQTQKLIATTLAPFKQVCSRNQYECRSSGDCIAIYNVCDGIPQCADGSDEAADLICPTEKPTIPPSTAIQGPPPPPPPPPPPLLPADIIKYPQMVDQHKPFVPIYPRGPENNLKPWELPNLAHQVITQQQSLLYPAQQMEIPQLHKTFGSSGYQWDYQPLYEQSKDPYNSANSYREQNMNPYEQEPPRIFNHKSSVIGESEANNAAYEDVKHSYPSHFSSSNRGVWQENQVQSSVSIAPRPQYKQVNEAEKHVKSTTPVPCDTSAEQKDSVAKSKDVKVKEDTEMHKFHEKINSQDAEKLSTLKKEGIADNHLPIKEAEDHKSVIVIGDHVREHERNNVVAKHLQQLNENEMLRPKGAVISLALGLTATAITATLIACRLRVVRRRGRRGHGPYAHDADYLVNGMYL